MSRHSKYFRHCNPIPDTRPSNPQGIPLYDPKRPGNSSGGGADRWTRRPTQPPRPGKPGAR